MFEDLYISLNTAVRHVSELLPGRVITAVRVKVLCRRNTAIPHKICPKSVSAFS